MVKMTAVPITLRFSGALMDVVIVLMRPLL